MPNPIQLPVLSRSILWFVSLGMFVYICIYMYWFWNNAYVHINIIRIDHECMCVTHLRQIPNLNHDHLV